MTNSKPIRIIFYGTSSFAVPILRALCDDKRLQIIAVVTQPDRPVGRHAVLTGSPVKQVAQEKNLDVRAYEKVKSLEAFEDLKTIKADVAVVASFGQIIPQRVLDLTPHGAINVHGSILPKYRGASPVAAAIREGEMETGITIMKMDALMDHGPVLAIAKESIGADDTAGSLLERLALLGAKTLPNVLVDYIAGQIVPQEQDHAAATTIGLLDRENGAINWNKPATEIERLVRAYDPWPGTFTMLDGKRLKILKTSIGAPTDLAPGTFFIHDGALEVACGEHTSLRLDRIQPEGKSPMPGPVWINGVRSRYPQGGSFVAKHNAHRAGVAPRIDGQTSERDAA